ncbi:hypothetical protein FF1_043930 [Malus domestica]
MAELFQAFLASQLTNQRNEEEKESEREATYLDRFLKLKPTKFCDTADFDKVETWIKNIKKKLDILKVPAKNRIQLATHVMEGEADSWWDTICDQNTDKEMTWDDFEQHFYDRYFPVALKQTRIKEFFELEQGNMTVAEYVSKYIELGKYAKALVADENTKVVKFMLGLKNGIRRYIMGQGTKTYREIVDAAYALEQDHLIFLKKKASASGSVGNKGQGARNRAPVNESGRVYALIEDDEATANNKMVLNGTILFSNTKARILFDIDASHSFIYVWLASSLGLKSKPVTKPLTLSVPLLGKISINQIFMGCKLVVKDQVLTVDLYHLEKMKYELSLGRDWLRKYQAQIDCGRRKVIIVTPEGNEISLRVNESCTTPSLLLKNCFQNNKLHLSLPLPFPVAFPSSFPVVAASPGLISIFSLSSCISRFDLDLLQESLHLPAPVYNYTKGKWVVDHKKLLYSGHGCKQCLSSMWSCRMTKRTDFSYEKVSWQPKDCQMEEFEGYKFLKRSPCMLLQHISSVGIVGIS